MAREAPQAMVDHMTPVDITAVITIEALSFPEPWPPGAYQREIETNLNAVYLVARVAPDTPNTGPPLDGVVGYAGLWMQHDEAHVSTLAVHPTFRRQGIGALLLLHLLEEAIERGASVATLEVRASNVAAKAMYEAFGFAVAGMRKGYYPDNREDALILTTPPLDDQDWRRRFRILQMASMT